MEEQAHSHDPARQHLSRDGVLRRLMERCAECGLQPAREFVPFQALASAITHQQLNGTAARRILERLVALYAPASFPTPGQLLASKTRALRGAGLSGAKVAALRDLATRCIDGTVPDYAALCLLDDAAIIERLTSVRGVGRWTVEMMLMFHLARPDVLPVDDFGVRNGVRLAYGLARMPRARSLAEYGRRWAPYRSVAAWYLWRAVDLHREGRLPARRGKAPAIELEAAPKLARTAKRKARAKVKAKTKVKKKARGARRRNQESRRGRTKRR